MNGDCECLFPKTPSCRGKERIVTMGKVKDWVIEMEEDASYMTRQEFMDKHGETVVEYYDELQLKWQYDHAEPGEPDDVG